jgi:hypothetical protein
MAADYDARAEAQTDVRDCMSYLRQIAAGQVGKLPRGMTLRDRITAIDRLLTIAGVLTEGGGSGGTDTVRQVVTVVDSAAFERMRRSAAAAVSPGAEAQPENAREQTTTPVHLSRTLQANQYAPGRSVR